MLTFNLQMIAWSSLNTFVFPLNVTPCINDGTAIVEIGTNRSSSPKLSLSGLGIGITEVSTVVEVILRYGIRLETLSLGLHRLKDSFNPHSAHKFITYALDLPRLRNFALRLQLGVSHFPDMLPAISDCLQDLPHLEALELVDTYPDGYIHRDYWNFLFSFPRLNRLAMNIPSHFSKQEAARIILRTVRSLALLGRGASAWFSREHLHLVCFIEVVW